MQQSTVLKPEYTIFSRTYLDGDYFLVYRRLPDEEYLKYYVDRKAEIYVDEKQVHWLFILVCRTKDDAVNKINELLGYSLASE